MTADTQPQAVQVLNDLLDPARANLKLREDPKRGFYVEGIKEETLVSAEHALSVIATGVAHRKVRVCYVLAAAALVHKDYLWLFTTSLRRHPLPPGFIATGTDCHRHALPHGFPLCVLVCTGKCCEVHAQAACCT